MANGRSHSTSTSQITTTVIRDINGEVLTQLELEETVTREPDGSTTSRRTSNNIQLTDSVVFNAGMLISNPPVYIGVCRQCRKFSVSLFRRQRPTHGITTLGRSKMCADCGTLCCPNHRRLSPDRKWRCFSCAKKYLAKEFIKSIFFSRRDI